MAIARRRDQLIIAPSLLAAPAANYGAALELVEKAGAEYIHIDIMDGCFVQNFSFGPDVISGLRKISALFFDVHLMIENPERYVQRFIDSGADCITVHPESTTRIDYIKQVCVDSNVKFGLALHPNIHFDTLLPYLSYCDLLLVMGVVPGFGGQTFLPQTIDRLRTADLERARQRTDFLISVDGGVNELTASECGNAGADILVAGSAIFSSFSPESVIKLLKGK